MKYKKTLSLLFLALVFSALGYGQVREKGEISGTITDEMGAPLPGVAVTLTGANLFQKSLAANTDANGSFRFEFLNPGTYMVEMKVQGFATLQFTSILVSAAKTTPIHAKMVPSKLVGEVTVVAKTPLLETKTPQVTINFDSITVQNLPNSRNFIDVVNATPGVNDNDAYGESGNVSGVYHGVYLARGSMTSTFMINSVNVSNPAYGLTYVNPIYETIEEVQITSIGATAEYGDFLGAAVNIVTKSGTNNFHGSLSGNYQGQFLYATKITKHPDYNLQYDWKYNAEVTGLLSGPIIKDKLFFSFAGGYSGVKQRVIGTTVPWLEQDRPRGYGKLDYRMNNTNTFSLMLNINPVHQPNTGLFGALYAASTAFTEDLRDDTIFASWNSILSSKSYLYVKFAGNQDHINWDPVTPGVPQYVDGSNNAGYGGSQQTFKNFAKRWSVNSQLSYYAEEFLSMSHEFKVGVEYDRARWGENIAYSGGGYLYSIPYDAQSTYWVALVGGDLNVVATTATPRAYIQDNLKVNKHLYLNLGLRYEHPVLRTNGIPGDVTKFNILSPRLGFSYDIKGDATTIIRGSFGIYYNQLLLGTYTNSMPGNTNKYEYGSLLPTEAFNPTFQNIESQLALVAQPGNLLATFPMATPVPVDPNLKPDGTNVFSLGFERQLGNDFAIELNYIYRRGINRYQIKSLTQHTYVPYQWTDPWLGHNITLWQQTDRNPDTQLLFTNSTSEKTEGQFIEFVLRKTPTKRWTMMFSYVFQNTKNNIGGTGSLDLYGTPNYNVDTDPQYYSNPLQWGRSWMHEHQFKLVTTYFGPWGINLSGDFRVMSGQPWAPEISASYIPRADRPYRSIGSPSILLEQRGSHNSPMSAIMNVRIGKVFKLRGTTLNLAFDIFNALNGEYYYRVNTQPFKKYSDGTSAYGQPSTLFPGRNSRFNIIWSF
ncbi:MAG: TonB-dependent receptor [Thermodesulfobacteriota bacterium]